jgi:NAD(P)-dependent dehydrogenase (short-subunit alcohol dehydrogenase family)
MVTGASRGLGRALAIELYDRDFDVVATMRDPADGEGLPRGIEVRRLDVTDSANIDIPRGLRVLVNNAGADCENLSVEDTPLEVWRRVFETNVFGLASMTQAALPVLREATDGVIVNVTSASIVVPMPFFSVYRASKAAVSAFGESLRGEVADHGIRVLEVLPGPITTDMLAGSSIVPEAVASEPYRPLAERVGKVRGAIADVQTPPAEAAATIVRAILDEKAPLRVACDATGQALLAGWDATSDEEWLQSFLDAFNS